MKVKRRGRITTAAVLSVVLLFGCSAQNVANKDTQKKKAQAVIVEEEQEECYDITGLAEKKVFVTKNCLYYKDRNDLFLVQCDLKGEKIDKNLIKNGLDFWVREDYVCHVQEMNKKNKEAIYIFPIEQKKGREKVKWKKKKRIAESAYISDTFAWDSYIYYISDTLYRYDYKTGETKTLIAKDEDRDYGYAAFQKKAGTVYMQNEKIYMNTGIEDEPLYSIEVSSGKVKEIGLAEADIGEDTFFLAKDPLVFSYDGYEGAYFCYDSKEKKNRAVLPEENIKKLLQENGVWKEDMEFSIINGFTYTGRLYLVVDLDWLYEKKVNWMGHKEKDYDFKQVLVSCPWEDIHKLSYEKEIGSYAGTEQDVFAEFWIFYKGEMFIDYSKPLNTGRSVNRLIGYDMKTGDVREIPEDTLYQIYQAG